MIRTFLTAMAVCMGLFHASAIDPVSDDLNVVASSTVKSLDEFIARFNGTERQPQVKDDSLARIATISTMFDWGDKPDNPRFDKGLIQEFIDSVIAMSTPLSLSDGSVWCELECEFSHDEKRIDAVLFLEQEKEGDYPSRWGITGIKGLVKSGIIGDRLATLSAVDHEIGFMSLNDWFNSNPKHVPALRSSRIPIDQMSFLFGLAASGRLKFRYVRNQKYHFLMVPGFIFSVKYYPRNSVNAGWLIDHVERAGEYNKLEYINSLFSE